jgi:hypothetical protein
MKQHIFIIILIAISLSACALPGQGGDPCSPPQLQAEVEKVHVQMRAFDDMTQVISNMPRNQVNDGIIQMQAIRRNTEDIEVPVCLIALKTYALGHMNAMIKTLIDFMAGSDVMTVNSGIAQAQFQHEKYYEERARLLGVTYTPEPTITPFPTLIPTEIYTPLSSDACAPENLPAEVERVNQYMRAFDDWSNIALNTPKQGLSDVIANLQSIRRQAQDLPIPECVSQLKQIQLQHMETVINTLLTFLSGSDSVLVSQGIALARSQHDQYNAEYARLLGITLVPEGAPLPGVTGLVTNSGAAAVKIRRYPVDNADVLATLEPGQTAQAVGKSLDGGWVLIYLPDNSGFMGWVSVEVLDVPNLEALPQVTPIP